MNNIDIIDRLPTELGNCLVTNCFFDDIPVVVAEKGNVAAEYARAQSVITEASGKRGIAVIVLQVVADDVSNSLQFGPMRLKPAFQVIESVELNNDDSGTTKSARKVARKIRDIIKTLNLIGLVQDMRTGIPCIEPVDLSKQFGDGVVAYQVNFECLEIGLQQITAIQLPQISIGTNPPQFVLSCATPGAEIWYTLDDTFPFNGDATDYPNGNGEGKPSTAQLYAIGTPVNIPPGGCTIRVRAYLDGDNYIASGINRAFLTNNS